MNWINLYIIKIYIITRFGNLFDLSIFIVILTLLCALKLKNL